MRTTRIAASLLSFVTLIGCAGGDSERESLVGSVEEDPYFTVEGQPDLKIHRTVTLVTDKFRREVVVEPGQLRVRTAGNEAFIAGLVAKRSVLMSGGVPEQNKLGFTRGVLGISRQGEETILRTIELPTPAFIKGTVRTVAPSSPSGLAPKRSGLALQGLSDDLESKRNERLAELISLRNDKLTLLDVAVDVSQSSSSDTPTITIRPNTNSYSSNGSFNQGFDVGEPAPNGTTADRTPDRPRSASIVTIGIRMTMDTRFDLAGSAHLGGGGCNILRSNEEGFQLGEEGRDMIAALTAAPWELGTKAEGVGAAGLCARELLGDKLQAEAQLEAFGTGFLNIEVTATGKATVTAELFQNAMKSVVDRLERLSPKFPVACGPVPCEVRIVPKIAASLSFEGTTKLTTKVPYGVGFVMSAGGGYNVRQPGLYTLGQVTHGFQGAQWDAAGAVKATARLGGAVEVSFGIGNSNLALGDYSADVRAFALGGADFVLTAGACPDFDWGAKIDPKAKVGVSLIGKYVAQSDDISPLADIILRESTCL